MSPLGYTLQTESRVETVKKISRDIAMHMPIGMQ